MWMVPLIKEICHSDPHNISPMFDSIKLLYVQQNHYLIHSVDCVFTATQLNFASFLSHLTTVPSMSVTTGDTLRISGVLDIACVCSAPRVRPGSTHWVENQDRSESPSGSSRDMLKQSEPCWWDPLLIHPSELRVMLKQSEPCCWDPLLIHPSVLSVICSEPGLHWRGGELRWESSPGMQPN